MAEKFTQNLINVSMAKFSNIGNIVSVSRFFKMANAFKLVQPESQKSFLTKLKYYFF